MASNLFCYLTLITILLLNCVKCENNFKSIPVTVKSLENDTVLLPCYLHETEPAERVRWYKDGNLIADTKDPNHLLPSRFRMWTNYSLELNNLQAMDTGDYTCDISRPEPWGPIKQIHSIEVQYAPTVRTIPEDGFMEVKKGDEVDFGCEATGSPTPIIDWKKNGEPMALLDHRSRIRFKAEHRLLAGLYQCVVNNGVGDPLLGNIKVLIQDAPVVSTERSFVHTAVGLRAVLSATLEFSLPAAKTHWYKEGKLVRTNDRIVQMVQDNVHQLIFRTVRNYDLGNYTFRAANKWGMADVSFRLTGVPNIAAFKVDPALNKATATSFTLIWEVDSYSTIIEYNLWLRPYVGRVTGDDDTVTERQNLWSKIVVPGDSTEGPIHSAIYIVRGLTPSTVYEAIVTSRNRFGWSKSSAVLHFATEPGAYRSKPSTSDYSDLMTPILEEISQQNQTYSVMKVYENANHANRFSSCGVMTTVLILYLFR